MIIQKSTWQHTEHVQHHNTIYLAAFMMV